MYYVPEKCIKNRRKIIKRYPNNILMTIYKYAGSWESRRHVSSCPIMTVKVKCCVFPRRKKISTVDKTARCLYI